MPGTRQETAWFERDAEQRATLMAGILAVDEFAATGRGPLAGPSPLFSDETGSVERCPALGREIRRWIDGQDRKLGNLSIVIGKPNTEWHVRCPAIFMNWIGGSFAKRFLDWPGLTSKSEEQPLVGPEEAWENGTIPLLDLAASLVHRRLSRMHDCLFRSIRDWTDLRSRRLSRMQSSPWELVRILRSIECEGDEYGGSSISDDQIRIALRSYREERMGMNEIDRLWQEHEIADKRLVRLSDEILD